MPNIISPLSGGIGAAAPMAAVPSAGGFNVNPKPRPQILDILSGLEGLSQKVSAGFADDPNVRYLQQQRIASEAQAKEQQNAQMAETLITDLRETLPAAQQMFMQTGKLSPGMQKYYDESLSLLGEMSPDPRLVEQFGQALWQQVQNPQMDPTTKKINALRAQGVELSPEDLKQMGGITPEGPLSGVAQAKADLDAGRITPEQFAAVVKKETYISLPTQINIDNRNLTEGQQAAGGFASRMAGAEQVTSGLESQGYRPSPVEQGLKDLPVIGNYLQSPETQSYMQAATDWITANLRKESGATITEDEFNRDFKRYFPQPGDSEEVIQQKAAARIRAQQAVESQSIPITRGEAESKQKSGGTPRDGIYTPKTDADFAKIPIGAMYVNPADSETYVKTSE